MRIRKAEAKDTREIWEAHVKSIREICSRDYSPEQIAGWSAFPYNHEHWLNMMIRDLVLVVELDAKVEGFCHAGFPQENMGEIYGLYFSPKLTGKGMGRKIINEALDFLKAKLPKQIILSSTRTSKDFYQKIGFSICGPEQLYKTRGVEFEYFPMELKL